MMASRVTPPAMEGEGAEENGTVEAVGSIVSTHGCFGLSCASLYQIKPEHMAPMMVKRRERGMGM